jgi:hypothetical protein
MPEGIEIRGGAGAFEAAVIAVVLDRIDEEERAARHGKGHDPTLSPWMLADRPEVPNVPMEIIRPANP